LPEITVPSAAQPPSNPNAELESRDEPSEPQE